MKRARALSLVVALAVVTTVMAQTPPGSSAAVSFTDARGALISLPAKATRIVSLSPELTEILYAVGAGRNVVGNTTYCNFPADALTVPKIGGFSAKTISLESIIALRPDLVVGNVSAHGGLAPELERAGLRFAALPTTSFEDVYATLELMGRVAGDRATATALIASMRARVEAVRERTAAIPYAKRPMIFWETWDEPLMSAGPGTFTGQIMEAAGGRNCFADSTADWPVVSFEVLLARNPDWIMAAESHGEALTLERLARRPGWSALKAVKDGKVVLLDGDIVARAGPRFVEALEMMAKVLYPTLF
ncbi:MAG: cobalamin-binding protein [Spirochaetales bacterium]|nr:cobalamin-binding protein [Spirochaetales bacterium]